MLLRSRPTFWNLATSVATVELGPGIFLLAAALLAFKLSLLPFRTSQPGPPDCSEVSFQEDQCKNQVLYHTYIYIYTRTTESLAAIARTSAQETVPGHINSSSDFIVSMTWNPLSEFKFGAAAFSPTKPPASSNKTEPSQPYKNKTRSPTLCPLA